MVSQHSPFALLAERVFLPDSPTSATEGGIDTVDLFEEKMKEAMDMASQKSSNGRVNALKNLCRGFLRKIVPDFVEERRATLTDLIEKALKRGKEDEQRAASILACLVCVQLGLSDDAEALFAELRPTITVQMLIETGPQRSRADMAMALGLLAFLQCPQEDTSAVMSDLEQVFRAKSSGAELQAEALSSWSLLSTFTTAHTANQILNGPLCVYMVKCLDSTDVDLRIAAGEALALLVEATEDEDGVGASLGGDVEEKIRALATDSNKYRSKKDRKEQRSTFRDVLKTIEGDGECPVYAVKSVRANECTEKLVLDSWRAKKHYDALRKVKKEDAFFYDASSNAN